MLQSPLAFAAILLGGTLTPGPNNLALLEIAAHQGRRAALTAIAAIVTGGLALYGLVQGGLGVWVAREPWARGLLLASSAGYLAWLGGAFLYRGFRTPNAPLARWVSFSALGLLAFQFVNPKAWMLMVSLSSAARCVQVCTTLDTLITLTLLLAIPTVSLLCWLLLSAGVGHVTRLSFERPLVQRVAGLLLLASALLLLVE